MINTTLLFVITLSFTPRLQADSLMVYFEPAGFDTFRIETSTDWQEVNLVFSKTSDLPITAIYFKPFTTQESIDSSGYNISFSIDNLQLSRDSLYAFDDSLSGHWTINENSFSFTEIIASKDSPDKSKYSVQLAYWEYSSSQYPGVTFKFQLPEISSPKFLNDQLTFNLKSGLNANDFKKLVPLQIGNKWVYYYARWLDDGDFYSIEEEFYYQETIIDTVMMPDSNLYYRNEQIRFDDGTISSQLLRYDNEGYLILYNGGNPIRLYQNFVKYRHGYRNSSVRVYDLFRKFLNSNELFFGRRDYNVRTVGITNYYIERWFKYGIGLAKFFDDNSTGSDDLVISRGFFSIIEAAEIDGIIYGDSSLLVSIVLEEINYIPKEYKLSNNYPNPFNPTTIIEYSLPRSGEVSLIVYNLRGQEVARLVDGYKPPGDQTATWDASNFASGIYFYRLQAGNFVQTRKMILLK